MVHLGLSFTVTLQTMHQTPHWGTTRKANISRGVQRGSFRASHGDPGTPGYPAKGKVVSETGNAVLCMKQNKSQYFQMFPLRFFLLYNFSNCRLPLVIAFQDIPQLFSILNLNVICNFLKCVIDSF